MKKLLIILALLAYVAISCEDKPNTLTGGDEPETEQPGTNPADTCRISVHNAGYPLAAIVFQNSSDEIDFESSIYSMFKHLTLTLNDGSYASPIGSNVIPDDGFTFDSGYVGRIRNKFIIDSLKHTDYLIILWEGYPTAWGPNYYNDHLTFLYRDMTFNSEYTTEIFICDELAPMIHKSNPLTFNKF